MIFYYSLLSPTIIQIGEFNLCYLSTLFKNAIKQKNIKINILIIILFVF